jgi:hypothetical protein
VLVAGYLHFATLTTIAVARPAILGVSVTRRAAEYYTEPREERHDRWGYMVGIAVRQPLAAEQRDDPALARLLAPRPDGQTDSLIQVLVLAQAPASADQPPQPDQAVILGRVTDGSVVVEGRIDVYPLYRLADCVLPTAAIGAEAPGNSSAATPAPPTSTTP